MLKLPRLSPRDIDDPIDDNVRDMYTLRPELARQRLSQRPQSKLARGKGREIRRPFQTGGCAGENQRRRMREAFRLKKQRQRAFGEKVPSFSVPSFTALLRLFSLLSRRYFYLPLTFITLGELFFRQLQERLAHKPATGIEDRRGEGRAGILL